MKELLKKPLVALLGWEAKQMLNKHSPIVIAITGSVGKTTTKDILYAGLVGITDVRAAKKSFNSEIGVPLAIMDLSNPGLHPIRWIKTLILGVKQVIFDKDFPELLVLEVGAGAPGDIEGIAQWICPDISVFTALAKTPVHIEFFDSKEQLYAEKKSLAEYTKEEGLVLYNGDDEILESVLKDISHRKERFVIDGEVTFNKEGTQLKNGEYEVVLSEVLGSQMMYPVTALIKIYKELGIEITDGLQSLSDNYVPTPGRARIIQGIDNTLLIDDAYNASPVAVKKALEVFEQFEAEGRKIFVFGDMMELGEHAEQAHVDVALQSTYVHELITVGKLSLDTYTRAIQLGIAAMHFETSVEAGEYLAKNHERGDSILFKSSRHSIKMEQAIVQMALPEEREKLVQEYL